jgi:hypothetical protein
VNCGAKQQPQFQCYGRFSERLDGLSSMPKGGIP